MALACKSCKRFHKAAMGCATAAALLVSGNMEEPWASLNNQVAPEPERAEQKSPVKPKREPKAETTKPFDRAAYMRDYMVKWRAKQPRKKRGGRMRLSEAVALLQSDITKHGDVKARVTWLIES